MKALPKLRLPRAPIDARERKATMKVCRTVVKAAHPGLTKRQIETFATQMYLDAVAEASRKIREPTKRASQVLVPKAPTERRLESGIILPGAPR